MPDIATTYMGLSLSNPVIVSSSSLTGTIDGVKRCASAGAGAIVLKSLFEEQVRYESIKDINEDSILSHPEAADYLRQMGMHLGPQKYLALIEEARAATSIPIIASLNCSSGRWWGTYAGQIEKAGASGIELNIAFMPRNRRDKAERIEDDYAKVVDRVRQRVALPVSVKFGPYFTSLPRLVEKVRRSGASALVMFNRFYQLDIDTVNEMLAAGYQFSSPQEMYTVLRWVSILSGSPDYDIAASTGIQDGRSAVKMILAGASAVQICSALFIHGLDVIKRMKAEISTWMTDHDYKSVTEFKGSLSQAASPEPELYERLQYIKAISGMS
jgi:dihydroorotate dehydrogenase (fumarate)